MAIKAAQSDIDRRRAICSGGKDSKPCDQFKPATPLKPWAHCGSCGCMIAAKTALANQSCPLKKW
jgi:hypothetical protein